MSRNIIKLSEDYGISADDLNIILMKRNVNKDEKSKNFGNEYYTNIGYYTTIEGLLKGMMNKQILLSVQESTSLESLQSDLERGIDKLYSSLAEVVKELRKEV